MFDYNPYIYKILLMVLSTAIIVAIITPLIKRIAIHIGAMDIPNERKVHSKPIPRLGGLGIFLGFLVGYMLFGEPDKVMNSILIAGFIVVLTGMIDDIKPLRASTKFMGQLVAACVVTFYGKLLLQDLSAFGFYVQFGFLAYPATIFFILGCINCINLIDGLDGLAGGISAIYFLTIGIISIMNHYIGLEFVLCFVMFGSCVGFLFHNFYPAKIFMGDSGSMLLGLSIAVIALLGFKTATLSSLIIPLLLIAIPILDTLFAILRRKLKGESIATPDKFHIHHQLLNRNFTQKQTVIIIYFIDGLFATASIIYALGNPKLGYIIYGVLLLIVLLFIYKTNVIFEHKKDVKLFQPHKLKLKKKSK